MKDVALNSINLRDLAPEILSRFWEDKAELDHWADLLSELLSLYGIEFAISVEMAHLGDLPEKKFGAAQLLPEDKYQDYEGMFYIWVIEKGKFHIALSVPCNEKIVGFNLIGNDPPPHLVAILNEMQRQIKIASRGKTACAIEPRRTKPRTNVFLFLTNEAH